MRFGQPVFLWGLAALPLLALLIWWGEAARRRALERLGEPALIARLLQSVDARGRRRQRRLWLLGMALALLALARPQWGVRSQIAPQSGVQLMVVLDISTSMLTEDVLPNRLTRARQLVVELLRRLDGDEIGLVLFAGASFVQFPLTNDYNTARVFLESVAPEMISRPGSQLGSAVETALTAFAGERAAQQVIVIISDGEHDDMEEVGPRAVARKAAEAGVLIYTVGVGTPQGGQIPIRDRFGNLLEYKRDRQSRFVVSRLEEGLLQEMATLTGGRYYRASATGDEIDQLSAQLDMLEQGLLQNRFEAQPIERFPLFLGAALAAFLTAELIPTRREETRPLSLPKEASATERRPRREETR